MSDLYEECDALVIKCGDLLLDPINNSEDMYLWSIYWTKINESVMLVDTYSQIEEFGLKMSIIVGLYDLVSRE